MNKINKNNSQRTYVWVTLSMRKLRKLSKNLIPRYFIVGIENDARKMPDVYSPYLQIKGVNI